MICRQIMYFNNSAHVLILSLQMRFFFKYYYQKDIWVASHIREWVKILFLAMHGVITQFAMHGVITQ